MKPQLRGAADADDFDIAPEHALRVSRAERLHRRFFGRETAGQMGRRIPPARRLGDLAVGEHATQKSVAKSRDGGFNPIDFSGIQPDADNMHGAYDPAQAYR